MREFRIVFAANADSCEFSERLAGRLADTFGGVTVSKGIGYCPPYAAESVLIFDCGADIDRAECFDFANMTAREIVRSLNQDSVYFRNIDGAAYILDGANANPYRESAPSIPMRKPPRSVTPAGDVKPPETLTERARKIREIAESMAAADRRRGGGIGYESGADILAAACDSYLKGDIDRNHE